MPLADRNSLKLLALLRRGLDQWAALRARRGLLIGKIFMSLITAEYPEAYRLMFNTESPTQKAFLAAMADASKKGTTVKLGTTDDGGYVLEVAK